MSSVGGQVRTVPPDGHRSEGVPTSAMFHLGAAKFG